MDILVGDLAKLYGLSSQTLHYYEEKGILNPKRNVTNGYRYFTPSDINKLGTIKKARNAGIPIVDTVDILVNVDERSIYETYKKQKETLLKEIQEKLQIINQIDEHLNLYNKSKMPFNDCEVIEMDEIWRFESCVDDPLFKTKRLRDEASGWFANILHTYASERILLDNNHNYQNYRFGMMVTKANATYLGLTPTSHVKVMAASKYVSLIINTDHKTDFDSQIQKALNYVKHNKFVLNGDILTRVVLIYKDDHGIYRHVKQLLVPIM